jgi:hypothetical protein
MEYVAAGHEEGFSPMQIKRMNEIVGKELPEDPCSAQVSAYVHRVMERNHAAMDDLIIEALRGVGLSWDRILRLCWENEQLYRLVSGESII